jgi:hypothetical protein
MRSGGQPGKQDVEAWVGAEKVRHRSKHQQAMCKAHDDKPHFETASHQIASLVRESNHFNLIVGTISQAHRVKFEDFSIPAIAPYRCVRKRTDIQHQRVYDLS